MEVDKMEINLSIGTVKTIIKYKNEDEKNVFMQVTKELNMEYNKVIMMLGNIDENILLFYLLLKTEIKLHNVKQNDIEDLLFSILRSIGSFIQSKNNEKIKENLAVINIIKKVELGKKVENSTENNDENVVLIDKLIEDIKDDIRNIEKKILADL
jgi:hypothetical protein